MGLDASWNDDFHHTMRVALTGRRDAYYTDYHGTTQEMISALKYGYLYQGQFYAWQQKRRGTPTLDLPPHAFVHAPQFALSVASVLHWPLQAVCPAPHVTPEPPAPGPEPPVPGSPPVDGFAQLTASSRQPRRTWRPTEVRRAEGERGRVFIDLPRR